MHWLRSHANRTSWLALFALAVQFALSFGHFHRFAAEATAVIQAGTKQGDLARVNGLVAGENQGTQRQSPADRDTDHQPGDVCAICALVSMVSTTVLASPPLLMLPRALERLYLT
ncbi:MAG: DUF2946 family protein, partial [Rhizomicrobium sp.]